MRFWTCGLLLLPGVRGRTCPVAVGGYLGSCSDCITDRKCVMRCGCKHNSGEGLRDAACNVEKCAQQQNERAPGVGNIDGVLFCGDQACPHPDRLAPPPLREGCPVVFRSDDDGCTACTTSLDDCVMRCDCDIGHAAIQVPAACNLTACAGPYDETVGISAIGGHLLCNGVLCPHPPLKSPTELFTRSDGAVQRSVVDRSHHHRVVAIVASVCGFGAFLLAAAAVSVFLLVVLPSKRLWGLRVRVLRNWRRRCGGMRGGYGLTKSHHAEAARDSGRADMGNFGIDVDDDEDEASWEENAGDEESVVVLYETGGRFEQVAGVMKTPGARGTARIPLNRISELVRVNALVEGADVAVEDFDPKRDFRVVLDPSYVARRPLRAGSRPRPRHNRFLAHPAPPPPVFRLAASRRTAGSVAALAIGTVRRAHQRPRRRGCRIVSSLIVVTELFPILPYPPRFALRSTFGGQNDLVAQRNGGCSARGEVVALLHGAKAKAHRRRAEDAEHAVAPALPRIGRLYDGANELAPERVFRQLHRSEVFAETAEARAAGTAPCIRHAPALGIESIDHERSAGVAQREGSRRAARRGARCAALRAGDVKRRRARVESRNGKRSHEFPSEGVDLDHAVLPSHWGKHRGGVRCAARRVEGEAHHRRSAGAGPLC